MTVWVHVGQYHKATKVEIKRKQFQLLCEELIGLYIISLHVEKCAIIATSFYTYLFK